MAREAATRTTATLTGMPRGGGVSDPVGDGVSRMEEARYWLRAIQEELEGMRAELGPVIEELEEPLERAVMQMRYLDGVSAREIAYRLSYSERHIFRTLAEVERKVELNG